MTMYAGLSPRELADAYDDQRAYVLSLARGSKRHTAALRDLAELSRELHAAERAAGVPAGSTRETRP